MIQFIEDSIKYINKQLSKDEFAYIYNLYKKEIAKLPKYQKKHIPKWYSLDNGPTSVNALAKHLEDDDPTTAMIYSFLSPNAHMYMTLSDFNLDDEYDEWIIKDVNQHTDRMYTFLVFSRSMMLYIIHSFVQKRTPTAIEEYKNLIRKIKPYIR